MLPHAHLKGPHNMLMEVIKVFMSLMLYVIEP